MTADEAAATLGLNKPATLPDAELAFEDLCIVCDPARVETDRLKERARVHLGKIHEAIETLRAHFSDDTAESLNARGLVHQRNGQLGDALEAFSRALELKKHCTYHYNRGLVHLQVGNQEKAIDDIKQASLMAPESVEVRESLGKLYLATAQYGLARREYEMVLRYKPENAAAHYANATSRALEDKSAGGASRSLINAIRLDPAYREMAEADQNFNGIRDYPNFQKWKTAS